MHKICMLHALRRPAHHVLRPQASDVAPHVLRRLLQVMRKVQSYVDDINQNPDILARGQRGPHSK